MAMTLQSDEAPANRLLERYSLAGMTAVVTGGAKGIGGAIVREFLALGCRVVVWDRTSPRSSRSQGALTASAST